MPGDRKHKTSNPAPKGPAAKGAPGNDRPGSEIKRVGGPRNEHGTRVARRVVCTKCGKVDHIALKPKDRKHALCRGCAEEVIGAYEVGVKAKEPMRKDQCAICDVPFELPARIDVEDPLCPNCLKGFAVWEGALETDFVDRRPTEDRGRGIRLRKRAPGGDPTSGKSAEK